MIGRCLSPGLGPDLTLTSPGCLASASLRVRGSLVWGHINICWDMTHHQDISFLKSKSVAHCKIHVFIVSNGGRLCLLQPKSGDHCDWGRRGTLSPHLDTALGCTHSCPPIRAQYLIQWTNQRPGPAFYLIIALKWQWGIMSHSGQRPVIDHNQTIIRHQINGQTRPCPMSRPGNWCHNFNI